MANLMMRNDMSGHPEELVELSEDLPGGYLGDK
jgi:hypothetical protein